MTLSIEFDLNMVLVDLHVKFLVYMSNSSVMRVVTERHMHTQTDRKTAPNSITSNADTGGKSAAVTNFYIYITLSFLFVFSRTSYELQDLGASESEKLKKAR